MKKYLTAKFDLGEQTGRKADPLQVSNDMRKAEDAQNNRLFTREEWLTKSPVQGFFSRLAATKRRQQGSSEIELDQIEGSVARRRGVRKAKLLLQKSLKN